MTQVGRVKESSTPDVLARVLSELLAPVVLAYVTCLSVAAATTPPLLRGVVVGVVVATLCAGLPYLLVLVASRRRLLSGRHVPDVRERPAVLGLCALSAVIGLAFASMLGASQAVFALIVATSIGLVVAAAVSTRWKLSIHVAGAAGAVTSMALSVSAWVLLAAPVVALLAWARVRLHAHDSAEVVGGALIGGGVTATVMLLLA